VLKGHAIEIVGINGTASTSSTLEAATCTPHNEVLKGHANEIGINVILLKICESFQSFFKNMFATVK
jgi:hypothetical protein